MSGTVSSHMSLEIEPSYAGTTQITNQLASFFQNKLKTFKKDDSSEEADESHDPLL